MAPYRKHIRQRDGRLTLSKRYYIRFQFNGHIHRPAAFANKEVSTHLENNIKRLIGFRQAHLELDANMLAWLNGLSGTWLTYLTRIGLIEAQTARSARIEPLKQAYVQSKYDAGCNRRAVHDIEMHLRTILDGIDAKYITDIKPQSVQRWLAEQRAHRERFGIVTSNHYLKDIKAFCNWLTREQYLSYNPLAHLRKLSEQTDRRRRRRAYTATELEQLLQSTASGPARWHMTGAQRAMLYRLAAETGLRARELALLRRSNLNLKATVPHLTVEAADAKSRRARTVPLRRDMADGLSNLVEGLSATALVFSMPCMTNIARMLYHDLADAGIPAVDPAGRVLDFHAFRRTFATRLRAAQVHPKVAQQLLGHSTAATTMDFYTDADLGDMAAAVESLPGIACSPLGASANKSQPT